MKAVVRCNLCGCGDFVDMRGRVRARCAGCGALERTRLLWLYLQREPLRSGMRVLHLAPEPGLVRCIADRVGTTNYRLADIDPPSDIQGIPVHKMDLCQLDDLDSDSFDLIVHSHVLEHTRCALAYTLFHLHRALKERGKHVFVVPFLPGGYAEDYAPPDAVSHDLRYGQADHVRRFGTDDLHASLGTLLRLPERWSATEDIGETELVAANVPRRLWEGFHGSTVLSLGRNDMHFIGAESAWSMRKISVGVPT